MGKGERDLLSCSLPTAYHLHTLEQNHQMLRNKRTLRLVHYLGTYAVVDLIKQPEVLEKFRVLVR